MVWRDRAMLVLKLKAWFQRFSRYCPFAYHSG